MRERTAYVPEVPDVEVSDDDYFAARAERQSDRARAFYADDAHDEQLSQRQALLTLSRMGQVLYAVSVDHMVKIGCTGNFANRRNDFMRQGSVRVLAFAFGDFTDEAAVHARLKPFRAMGREYYYPTPEVLEVVNGWRAAVNRPALTALDFEAVA